MDFDTIVNIIVKEMNNKNNHIHGFYFDLPSLSIHENGVKNINYAINYYYLGEHSSITADINYKPNDDTLNITMTWGHDEDIFIEEELISKKRFIEEEENIKSFLKGFFARCINYYTEMWA